MNKYGILFAAGLLLAFVLWGPASQWVLATSHPPDVTITVSDFEFFERDLEIDQGDTVRWVNQSGTHNVASISGPQPFRNGPPAAGGWSFEMTFNTPGVYSYICEESGHVTLGMTGTIKVNERFFYHFPLIVKPGSPAPFPTPDP